MGMDKMQGAFLFSAYRTYSRYPEITFSISPFFHLFDDSIECFDKILLEAKLSLVRIHKAQIAIFHGQKSDYLPIK